VVEGNYQRSKAARKREQWNGIFAQPCS
jgi:hypothetical protein